MKSLTITELEEELRLLYIKRKKLTLELANLDTEIIGIKLSLEKINEQNSVKKRYGSG